MARTLAGAFVFLLVLTACQGKTAVETTTTAAPTTTTTTPASTTAAPAACESVPVGIGDPVFAFAGNPGYDVDLYDIDITFNLPTQAGESTSIAATVVISATATEALDSLNFDLADKTVNSVSVDGSPVTFCAGTEEITVTPASPIAAGSDFTVTVQYEGNPFKGSSGIWGPPWVRSGPGLIFFGEPLGAHSWLVANNHPSDGARVHLTATVPAGLTVVGPGELKSTVQGTDTNTFRWELDQPIATYLIPLAIDEFAVREFDGPVPITVWYDAESAGEVAGLAVHGEIIEALAEWFGPFPYDRTGAIVFDPASVFLAALETTPYATYSRDIFPLAGARVVAHELAHMWAGNSVRLEAWDDIWLKEGLATYAEWLWAEKKSGTITYEQQAAAARGSLVQTLKLLRLPPMGAPRSSGDLYGVRSYYQGGLAFAALREMLGDDDFRAFLQQWLGTYAGQAAGTDEFLDLLRAGHGDEPVALIEGYLGAAGMPPGLEESG